MKNMPDIEKTCSKEEISCLNGRRKVCVSFQTDTENLKIVVYPYRNSLYVKDNEADLKLTEY